MNEHKTYFIALQLSLLLLLLVFLLLLLLLFLHHNTGTRYIAFSVSATIQLGRQSTFSTFAFGSCNSVKAAKTKNTEPLSMVIFFSDTLLAMYFPPTQAVPVAMEWPKKHPKIIPNGS